MEASRAARRSARRASLIGALMALIVFGGAVAYFLDTRPSAYRAEGGDCWALSRYRPAPGRAAELAADLAARVRAIDDAAGFFGMEVLTRAGEVVVVTRWRTCDDERRLRGSPRAAGLSPAPGLAEGPPAEELFTVIAR
jgi:hypothetical protein